MYKDEIIAEVWRNRDAYAEKHHHSLAEIVADLQARQKITERKLVDRRARTKGGAPAGWATMRSKSKRPKMTERQGSQTA